MSHPLRTVVVLLVCLAFAAFVWPTRYRYDHVTLGQDVYPVRIDRFTGRGEMLVPGHGWMGVDERWEDEGDVAPDQQS